MRSEKEMVRPNTLRRVAMMTNLHPLGYGAKMQFPRGDVGSDIYLVVAFDASIPVSPIITAQPEPAILGFVHKLPKTILQRSAFLGNRLVAGLSAIFPDRMIRRREILRASDAAVNFRGQAFLRNRMVALCAAIFSDRCTIGDKRAIAY